MNFNNIVRRALAISAIGLRHCDTTGSANIAMTKLHFQHEVVLSHQTTNFQRYIVQRLRSLTLLNKENYCYTVRRSSETQYQKLHIQMTPAATVRRSTFTIALTTRCFGPDPLLSPVYVVERFKLSQRRVSDVQVMHFRRQSTATRRMCIDPTTSYITELSEETLKTIECLIPGELIKI